MGRRGRKPKSDSSKGYFLEKQEQAVIDYNASNDKEVKNQIYNDILKPAFSKMIESIIRRYHLYVPEEEFAQTFDDTLSFMLTKIGNYRPYIYGYWEIPSPSEKVQHECVVMSEEQYREKKENATDEDPKYIFVEFSPQTNLGDYFYKYFGKELKHFKAYSYCGTVSKNYLIQRINQYQKKLIRNTPYDDVSAVVENDIKHAEEQESESNTAGEIISAMSCEIRRILDNRDNLMLTENETKVGTALILLLDNWEEILNLDTDDSNKLNKSSVLYFLREETRLDTKDIRNGMKRFKSIYGIIKEQILN